MREIKFRAWDKERGIMKVPYFHEFEDINIQFEDDELAFMQYTGLKDKNGVEIYESDILGEVSDDWGNCVVEYHNGLLCAKSIKYGTYRPMNSEGTATPYRAIQHYEGFEVIGNMYENLELLGDRGVKSL